MLNRKKIGVKELVIIPGALNEEQRKWLNKILFKMRNGIKV